MLRYKYISIIIFILLLVLSISVSAVEIYIPDQVDVSNDDILLGDIAQISGVNEEIIEKIKSIELAKSPLPGYSKRLSRELIRLVLKNKGYDVENIMFNIPTVFTVNTKYKKISIEKLINFAQKYIKDNVSYTEDQIEIEIKSTLDEIVIPDSSYELKNGGAREIKPGNNSLPLIIDVNGEEYKRVYLTAKIKLIRNVYIANRDLKRGIQLKREDFRLEQKEIVREIRNLITEWDEDFFKDRVLASSVQKGEILKETMVEKPFVISWGDKVQALIKIGSVQISAVVSARERGKIGDYITVQNTKTGHSFNAEVVNSHLVKIEKK